jgi:hypothetical protein
MAISLIILLLPLVRPSWAFESDQLTPRSADLRDGLADANTQADAMLAAAVRQTNERTRCAGRDDQVAHVLADEIRAVMGAATLIAARGELPAMAYGAYAAWLEDGPIDRYTFVSRNDLYSEVEWQQSPVLGTWGPSATVRLGTVLVGVDKIDHFWVQGHLYYEKARRGRDSDRAIRYGTRTEWMRWGMLTTGVFSFADLAANYDGYTFYRDLLGPGSLMQRADDGCVVQVRGFDWEEYVDWEYDEVANPPVYRKNIQERVDRYLDLSARESCADWLALPPPGPMELRPGYVGEAAPPRVDPFRLAERCGD